MLNHSCALNLGIIHHPRRTIEFRREDGLRIPISPRLNESGVFRCVGTGDVRVVRGSDDTSISDHARHANSDAIELRHLVGDPLQCLHESFRRKRVRRLDSNALGNHLAFGIEHRAFDPRPAAVDPKGQHPTGSRRH